MKKILSLSLCLVLILSGCSLTIEKVDNTKETTVPEETFNYTEVTEIRTENETYENGENITVIVTEKETVAENKNTCTFYIECKTILNNTDKLKKNKKEFVPADGVILKKTTVTFTPGETVFDVLKRVCKSNNIQMESSYTPGYDNYYIEGINQIYEKDCGTKSGWMYSVNGIFPNYGCSDYKLKNGDTVEWKYTCDLGADIGDNSMA